MTVSAENTMADQELIFSQPEKGYYRKLLLHKRRLIGAIIVGDWPDLDTVQAGVISSKRISHWQALTFRRTGKLWHRRRQENVSKWSEDAIVCQCAGVTRGELSKACKNGCKSLDALTIQTGAANACLSCRSLIAQLLNDTVNTRQPIHQSLLLIAILILIFSVTGLLIAPLPYSQTSLSEWSVDELWLNSSNKQISGFSLLGLLLFTNLLSMRKRWQRVNIGNISSWRCIHGLIGFTAILLVVMHTGMHTGEKLNFLLFLSFILASVFGGLSAFFTALENRLLSTRAIALKQLVLSTHRYLLWPLPVLLSFHVLNSYYF